MSGYGNLFSSLLHRRRQVHEHPHESERRNDSIVPCIRAERPHTPATHFSDLLSEPLDVARWDQLNNHVGSPSSGDSSPDASSHGDLYSYFRRCSLSMQSAPSSSALPAIVDERPPEYIDTVPMQPDIPIQYTFTPMSYSTMILSQNSKDGTISGPRYHIAIGLNCFHTSRLSDEGEYGTLVGGFKMGFFPERSTLTIDGKIHPVRKLLTMRFGPRHAGYWAWVSPGRTKSQGLLWDCRILPFTCKTFDTTMVLAEFTPFPHPGGIESSGVPMMGRTLRPSKLIVNPQGQKVFDDIVLSLLVIERTRVAPKKL